MLVVARPHALLPNLVIGDVLFYPVELLFGDFALRVALLQDFQSALKFFAAWAIIAAPARAAYALGW